MRGYTCHKTYITIIHQDGHCEQRFQNVCTRNWCDDSALVRFQKMYRKATFDQHNGTWVVKLEPMTIKVKEVKSL